MTMIINKDKIACFSDLHLGIKNGNDNWHDVAIKCAHWIKDTCKKHKIRDIILCGDVFHYRDSISVMSLHRAGEFFQVLQDFNIIVLVGNHDAYYRDSSEVHSLNIFKQYPNIHVVDETVYIEYKGVKIGIVPWGVPVQDLEKCDIIFGHFEIQNFHMNQHKQCTHGEQTTDIFSKCKTLVSGHFHLKQTKKFKQGTICYLGNPFQMDFGDVNDDKGLHIIDLTTQEIQFIHNDESPKFVRVYLSEIAKAGDITKELVNKVNKNVVKLIIDEHLEPLELDVLTKMFNKMKPFTLHIDKYYDSDQITMDDIDEDAYDGMDYKEAIQDFSQQLQVSDDIRDKASMYVLGLLNRVKI